jgi:hypothetical protein
MPACGIKQTPLVLLNGMLQGQDSAPGKRKRMEPNLLRADVKLKRKVSDA